MSWEFLKGDAIRLTFIFKENDSVYDDSGATKIRVFCYGNKGKTYFFGDEFSKNNGEWIAQFESERTSGNAGASILTAQLLDNYGNLINSANINLLVIESNTTTPFVSSPHFKDDAIAEIYEVAENVKQEIDSWSDQSNRLANLEASTQALQVFKSNSGALHFGAGQGFAYKTGATISSANVEISFMFRVVGFDWEANTGQTFITDFFQFGGNGGVHEGVWLGYYGAYMSLQCSIADKKRATICSADSSKYFPLLKLKENVKESVNEICVVFKTDAYSNVSGTIYFNGKKISGTSNAPVLDVYKDSFRLNASAPTKAFTYKDVCVFNFDVSDTNAPYTLSDYQQGKPIPVECLDTSAEQRALLALENYTIKVGESQKVLDYSGNANDATCTGSVKGDNDTRISAFVNAITGK